MANEIVMITSVNIQTTDVRGVQRPPNVQNVRDWRLAKVTSDGACIHFIWAGVEVERARIEYAPEDRETRPDIARPRPKSLLEQATENESKG